MKSKNCPSKSVGRHCQNHDLNELNIALFSNFTEFVIFQAIVIDVIDNSIEIKLEK
jgi:hypothetical protein